MTAPVDVLAGVRDTLIVAANNPVAHGRERGLCELMKAQAARIEEQRAAVAELLEACAECEQLESIFPCAPENMPDPVAYHAKMQAAYALATALARCKGGAA